MIHSLKSIAFLKQVCSGEVETSNRILKNNTSPVIALFFSVTLKEIPYFIFQPLFYNL